MWCIGIRVRMSSALINKMCTIITVAFLLGVIVTTVVANSTSTNVTDFNKTELHRIIQPSQSQTKPTVLNITAATRVADFKEFRPSPQLDMHYEYNKFPVPPAMPEAKTFGTVEKIAIYSTIPQDTTNVWSTRVRFPPNHPITVNDHPYPFTKDVDKLHESSYLPPVIQGTGVKIHSQQSGGYEGSRYPYGDAWDKTLKQHKPSKSFYGDDGGGSVGGSGHTDLLGGSGGNPWKKIIKLLAAVIPIGLLISALTPSVITIMPTNGTSYRNQARDLSGNAYGLTLLSKLTNKNCDERIFCELLLSAEESKNTDKDVEVLLDNFLQGNGNSEKLNRIYKAIRNGNCTALHCDTIPNH